MNFFKTVSLLFIVGLCSYALLLYLTPVPAESESIPNQAALSLPASSSAQTRIFFSPSYLISKSPQITEVPIVIQTGENAIHQAQLEIKYNPAVITVIGIKPADFFISPITLQNEVDQDRGRINFAVSSENEAAQIKGNGNLAILSFSYTTEASGSGKTQLEFLPKTTVIGSEQRASLLQSTENLIIERSAKTL